LTAFKGSVQVNEDGQEGEKGEQEKGEEDEMTSAATELDACSQPLEAGPCR